MTKRPSSATNAVKVLQNHSWNQTGKNLHALEAVMKGSCWVLLWNYNKRIFSHCQFCQKILKHTTDCQFEIEFTPNSSAGSVTPWPQSSEQTRMALGDKRQGWASCQLRADKAADHTGRQGERERERERERENVNERTKEMWTRHLNL